MRKSNQLILAVIACLSFIQIVNAHVELDYPTGGETFSPGEIVTVKWHVVIEHDPIDWDLYFSSDGGETWEVIASLRVEQLEYAWTVPERYTETGRIKIIQDNDTQPDYDDVCGEFTIQESTTPVPLKEALHFRLYPNSPNPFKWNTSITYELPEKSNVVLSLYTIDGSKIATLLDTETPPGKHSFNFHRKGLPEGFYLYQIQIGNFTETRKMLIMD